jgi:hypothetical protein
MLTSQVARITDMRHWGWLQVFFFCLFLGVFSAKFSYYLVIEESFFFAYDVFFWVHGGQGWLPRRRK